MTDVDTISRLEAEVERLRATHIKDVSYWMDAYEKQQEALRRVVEALDNICKFYCDWYDGKDHKSAGADTIAYDMKCSVAEALAFARGTMGCPTCGGTGGVDSGGVTPWMAPIDIPCPSCEPDTRGAKEE